MPLAFHWFLPTYGDSRSLVGGGHGGAVTASGHDRPATAESEGQRRVRGLIGLAPAGRVALGTP
jgi:hypothetical protein